MSERFTLLWLMFKDINKPHFRLSIDSFLWFKKTCIINKKMLLKTYNQISQQLNMPKMHHGHFYYLSRLNKSPRVSCCIDTRDATVFSLQTNACSKFEIQIPHLCTPLPPPPLSMYDTTFMYSPPPLRSPFKHVWLFSGHQAFFVT